jgi:asparagine synthase (glutamine-hydrolysing)
VDEMLSEEKIKDYGYFDAGKVSRLTEKCKRQDGKLSSERENMALVGILSTQLVHSSVYRELSCVSCGREG